MDNPLQFPSELAIARYRFTFEVGDSMLLPTYAGSTIRGVFGHALRKTACMTKMSECGSCPLRMSCPYTTIFDVQEDSRLGKGQAQNPPAPYIIEAPEDKKRHYDIGDALSFNVVLFGIARQHLALIIYTLQQAFSRGVGPGKAKASLSQVDVQTDDGWQTIYTVESPKIQEHKNTITLPSCYAESYCLQIKTPMRIQVAGEGLGIYRVNPRALLLQLLRRVETISLLYLNHSLKLDKEVIDQLESVQSEAQLSWQDWKRYSNRQQQEMSLGGIIGEWTLQHIPPAFAQLLYIGQWLHIGKQTVFGHGRYELVER